MTPNDLTKAELSMLIQRRVVEASDLPSPSWLGQATKTELLAWLDEKCAFTTFDVYEVRQQRLHMATSEARSAFCDAVQHELSQEEIVLAERRMNRAIKRENDFHQELIAFQDARIKQYRRETVSWKN